MSEIPEGASKEAHNIANGLPVGDNRQAIVDAISRAILAERKRCAEVARHLNGWGPVGGNKVAEHIAKIIESGK